MVTFWSHVSTGVSMRFAALLTILLMISASGAATGARASESGLETGKVTFRTSCQGDIRDDFDRAVALLHSFEYPESEKSFRAILAKAPDCLLYTSDAADE